MPILNIRLVGEAAVHGESGFEVIRPRKAFQLLILVALAPGQTLDRAEAARNLWPSLDVAKQADCLRPCLSRLKKELARLDLEHCLTVSDLSIAFHADVRTDLDEVLRSKSNRWQDSFTDLLHPVLSGWEPPIADAIRSEAEIAFASRLEGTMMANQDQIESWQPIVEQFRRTYPFNARIVAIYFSVLRKKGFSQMASELVEHFEIDWLDEYGQHDLPDIATLAQRAEELEIEGAKPKGVLGLVRRAPFQATVVGLALYFILMYTFSKIGEAESVKVAQEKANPHKTQHRSTHSTTWAVPEPSDNTKSPTR